MSVISSPSTTPRRVRPPSVKRATFITCSNGCLDLLEVARRDEVLRYGRAPRVQRLVGLPLAGLPLGGPGIWSRSAKYSAKLPAGSLKYQNRLEPRKWRPSPHTFADRVDGEQVLRALADLVDVVHLPRRVVEERHRGTYEPDVVVVVRAAQECDDTRREVAQVEPEHIVQEAHAAVEVGRAVEHMTQPARARGALVEDRRRTGRQGRTCCRGRSWRGVS